MHYTLVKECTVQNKNRCDGAIGQIYDIQRSNGAFQTSSSCSVSREPRFAVSALKCICRIEKRTDYILKVPAWLCCKELIVVFSNSYGRTDKYGRWCSLLKHLQLNWKANGTYVNTVLVGRTPIPTVIFYVNKSKKFPRIVDTTTIKCFRSHWWGVRPNNRCSNSYKNSFRE
jgi:hypothetical protein